MSAPPEPRPLQSPSVFWMLRKQWQGLFKSLRQSGNRLAGRLPKPIRSTLEIPVSYPQRSLSAIEAIGKGRAVALPTGPAYNPKT